MTIRSRRQQFLAGVLAAGPAVLIVVAWHILSGRPGFLEALSDGFVAYVPLDVFSAALGALGPLAKGLLYVGISLAALLAGGVFAPFVLDWSNGDRPVRAALRVGLVVLAAAELVVLPLFNAGFLGLSLQYDRFTLHAPLVVGALAYGYLLVGFRDAAYRQPQTAEVSMEGEAPANPGLSRRVVLSRGLVLVGAASLGGAFIGVGSQVLGAARHGPANDQPELPSDPFGPTPAVTPVADFYQVNKNLLPTSVDEASWKLVVGGLVDHPAEYSLSELRSMPSQTAYRTLECISTDITRGDHLVSNQKWRGVRVSDLLDRAGVQPSATWILWEADDGFTESIPIDVARQPDTWIAYEMGDQPLTTDHGFPARVLIAGRFGMKQPKWLRKITLADHNESGYWENRGWDEQAVVRTMSRIDFPDFGQDVVANQPFPITGIANAGDRGISKVELSLDGGQSWVTAEIEAGNPGLGKLTWVRWRYEATLPKAGAYSVVVRATDGAGAIQDGIQTDPLPSGSTGWHRRLIVAE